LNQQASPISDAEKEATQRAKEAKAQQDAAQEELDEIERKK